MKTKKFLLATAGSTVDGRNIDDKMIAEMAKSYDPKTYGARLNIEHIRGLGTEGPFRAYGDVLELSTETVDVNFNGTNEKRLGLFGTFDVDDTAKALNEAGQKVYPSIEIEPNFAGKGFAYMMGCALTDSPAAIGTERLQFNRALPGAIEVTAKDSGIEAAVLEFAEETKAEVQVGGFFAMMTEKMKNINFTSASPVKTDPEPKVDANPDAQAFAAMTAVLGDITKQMDTQFAAQNRMLTNGISAINTKFAALETKLETTEAPNQHNRSLSNGTGQVKTDC
ncbi:GPO family capsid scaffolding protein [Parasphingorhabdus sp. JC815]|uniref:GPO family capsid scaffolding protein n=1 Tax=Parasphingorhabdus sp. JC815 TaxID=3232140 RepID=UPI00345A070C